MLLAELTATSEAVRATPARTEKIERLAQTLRRMAPDEVAVGVAYLSGELRQRQIGVGYRSLRQLPPPATQATLGLTEVDVSSANSTDQSWQAVVESGDAPSDVSTRWLS